MRTNTGIGGLDSILGGGIIRGSNLLIEGAPGTGKTTFGLQFLYQGATLYNEPGVYVTFEEYPEQIYRDAGAFGWNLRKLEEENRFRLICTSPELIRGNLNRILSSFIEGISAKRIVVDSITHFQRMAGRPSELREIFYQFISGLKRKGLSAFLIKEKAETGAFGGGFEEFVVDSIVHLSFEASKWQGRRRFLEVLKSRGHESVSGRHLFRIGRAGIVAFASPAVSEEIISEKFLRRISTGVPGLDELVGGGLMAGTSTVIAGGPGTGRTTFCLQFLCAGVKEKESGLFISFHERPNKIYAAIHSYGMMRDAGSPDLFQTNYFPPSTLDVNELFYFIENTIKEKGIRRLVLDSLTNLEYAVDSAPLLGEYLYKLSSLLEREGVTSLLTYGVIGGGGVSDGDQFHLPMLLDNTILLFQKVVEGESKRFLSILKMRMSGHAEGPQEFTVTDKGIILSP